MSSLRRTSLRRASLRRALTVLTTLSTLIVPAVAAADVPDPTGFHLDGPALLVHERDGAAVVTVTRTNTLAPAQVRFGDSHLTATPDQDYTPTGGRLDFVAGQASATFSIPIVDHGVPGPPRTLTVYLYGASPIGLAEPNKAVLTIVNDDVVNVVRQPGNPLGLPSSNAPSTPSTPSTSSAAAGAARRLPPAGNPLAGARLYVDHTWGLSAITARKVGGHAGGLLGVIAAQPQTQRFGAWDGPDPSVDVSRFLERAAIEQPGSIPLISTYRLVGDHCRPDTAAQVASYERWIDGFANGISTYRAVVFLEMDSLITSPCLGRRGLATREAELRYATTKLAQLPRTVVYLDAGAADALPANATARILNASGVRSIQGFFLNSTHFDWTSREMRYGWAVSRRTGGKHFVVNTAVNGRGPLVPRDRVHQGNEVLCNPPGRGLGPKPTTHTGFPKVDAFAWIGNPGRSGGACRAGAPPTGQYWLALALELVRNADFRVR